MLEAVGALLGGLEGEQRVEEVRHPEAVVGPAAQVGGERLVVGGVVRQQRGELLDGGYRAVHLAADVVGGRRALGREVDRAVLGLPGTDGLDRILERGPGRVLDDARPRCPPGHPQAKEFPS